jgi:phosphohistidine swiveling domain-containing protein
VTAAQTDFPIPPDVEGFWLWDRLHCPRPLTPLEHELLLISTGEGFSKAIGEMGSQVVAVTRSINYYNYLHGEPLDIGSERPEERKARYDRNVEELMPKLGDLWENTWLPEMLPKLERARNTEYTTLSDEDLLQRFDEMAADVLDRWWVHGMLLYSFHAANVFADYYNEVMETDDQKLGYEALQGFETMATKSSRGLWSLSRTARNNPDLRRAFDALQGRDLYAELQKSEAGREFLADLEAYLEEFGWRADSVYELTRPSWREDPSIALNAIQGFVSLDDGHGPQEQYESAVRRREELLGEAREKLANDPERLEKLNRLYDNAKSFTPIVEDHNHWIDQMGDILMRYPALEIGARLVSKGAMEKPDDVFMLHVAEIKEAMAGADKKALIAERRTEMDHFATIVPPPAIGVPPPPTDPVEDVLFRFFGGPVDLSTDPAVINGIAASPGTARGPAKVVRDLAEGSKVKPGDVLVCEMTLPPWTPLFSTACAVVADTGGILSHCAIVAREYRIPCVVGTGIGTTQIKDGQLLTVDGTKGIVRIEG